MQSAAGDEESGGAQVNSGKAKVAIAMSRILAKPLKSTDRAQPILAAHRGPEKQIDDRKLEQRALKSLREEKRQKGERWRLRPSVSDGVDKEKRMKKVATRGVVKLFNAIRAAQKTDEAGDAVVAAAGVSASATMSTKKAEVATAVKKSFLSMLNAQK